MPGWLIRIIEWNYFNEHECNVCAWKKLHGSLERSSKREGKIQRMEKEIIRKNVNDYDSVLSKCTGSLSLAFIKKQFKPPSISLERRGYSRTQFIVSLALQWIQPRLTAFTKITKMFINPAARSLALYHHWLLYGTNETIRRCALCGTYRWIPRTNNLKLAREMLAIFKDTIATCLKSSRIRRGFAKDGNDLYSLERRVSSTSFTYEII